MTGSSPSSSTVTSPNVITPGNTSASAATTTIETESNSPSTSGFSNSGLSQQATMSVLSKDDDAVKLFIGQIPKTMLEDQLRPLFVEYGQIFDLSVIRDKATGQHRGCAFLTYTTKNAAEAASAALHNRCKLPDAQNPLQIRLADIHTDKENKLFVGMLPKSVDEMLVQSIFAPYGKIKEIHIIKSPEGEGKGCAFVKFVERSSALKAIDELNERHIVEGANRPIVVNFAHEKKAFLPSVPLVGGIPGTSASAAALFARGRATGPLGAGAMGLGGPGMSATPGGGRGRPGLNGGLDRDPYPNPYGWIGAHPGYGYQGQMMHHMPPYMAGYGGTQAYNQMYYPHFLGGPGAGVAPGAQSDAFAYANAGHTGFGQSADSRNVAASIVSRQSNSKPLEGPAGANLFIYHLPHDLTDADLATAFNPFGTVISAKVYVDKVTGESKGFGFVSYDAPLAAEAAIKSMNGFQIGSKRLKVQHKRISGTPQASPQAQPQGTSSYAFPYNHPSSGGSTHMQSLMAPHFMNQASHSTAAGQHERAGF